MTNINTIITFFIVCTSLLVGLELLTTTPTTEAFSFTPPVSNCNVNTILKSSSDSKTRNTRTTLFYANSNNNGNNNNGNNNGNDSTSNNKTTSSNSNNVRRTSIKGISVSPSGFLMLLQTTSQSKHTSKNTSSTTSVFHNTILPIRITSTIQDSFATTSAESLTICQLLSGVDMAGAIFNPDTLKHLVGLYCSSSLDDDDDDDVDVDVDEDERDENGFIIIEDELGLGNEVEEEQYDEEYYEEAILTTSPTSSSSNNSNNIQPKTTFNSNSNHQQSKTYVHECIQSSLDKMDSSTSMNIPTFEDANTWQRNRVKFPKISLDSIQIDLPFVAATTTATTTTTTTTTTAAALTDDDNYAEDDVTTESTIELWNDYIVSQMKNQQEEENVNGNAFQQSSILPLPLQFTLECRIDDHYKLNIPLFSEMTSISSYLQKNEQNDVSSVIDESRNMVQQVLYTYDDCTSGSFLALALALRYECPIVVTARTLSVLEELQSNQMDKDDDSSTSSTSSKPVNICIQQQNNDKDEEIQSVLPQWRSTNSLQSQSQRVVENIEQGFQITKLQGALKIALSRGDDLAVKKIRAEIEKLMNGGN